jgi:RNA polymerase sigma-70 factor (ECF subfamily)
MIRKLFRKKETLEGQKIMTDKELVESALAGSKDAWKELIGRHFRLISSVVFRITGGRDTDDVIQEVLIQLFRSLGSFRSESEFSTFLYRLTLNTACREVKRMTNLSSLVSIGNEVVEKMIDRKGSNDCTYDSLEKDDMTRMLQSAMGKISEEHRLYLTLHIVEGITLREISEMFDAPITTVASRIKKARVMLLKEMEKLL